MLTRTIPSTPADLAIDYERLVFARGRMIHADCMEWLARIPEDSLYGIVTDPPYGHREYEADEIAKLNAGRGGIWRIPPTLDGVERAPLPRFTALDERDRARMLEFFTAWSRLALRALRPGAHVFIASNAFIVPVLMQACIAGGLEFRGQIIRTVQTLRGGDRPKNAEKEFPGVSSLPRGGYEPWGLFRKPLPGKMTVAEALRIYGTGGLRRLPDGRPFGDLVTSERTPAAERALADHPSLKPQSLMRLLTYVALPLGEGVIADPFAGSGSTVAAAEAVGVSCIGVERHAEYYQMANTAVPALAKVKSKVDALLNGLAPTLGLWEEA